MNRHSMPAAEQAVLEMIRSDASAAAAAGFADLAAQYFSSAWSGAGNVSCTTAPAALDSLLAAPPPRAGSSLDDVLQFLARDVIANSNRLAHPMCMGHQVSPPLPAAVWVEPVISALNQSLAVREMSPAGTTIERALLSWLASLAGMPPEAGGAFTSGGTEANFTALLAARAAALPDAWQHGVGADPPVLVCGEHAHYSVARAAGQLGIGVANVVTVPSLDFRMHAGALPAVLDELATRGRRVLAVVASAGSTATGSFDDLEHIADTCASRGAWLHVDAAHGGSALLSERHRHRLHGIERADSLAWDPHKMMLLPIPCSAVIVRHEALLDAAFMQTAPYLFAGGSGARTADQGVRSFACSRRFDALKLRVALQRYGTDGLAALYDRLCRMAAELHARILEHPAFTALHEPQSNILCFRWTGAGSTAPATRAQPDAVSTAATCTADLDTINRELRDAWNGSGNGWITTTVLDGVRVLRVTIMNPLTSEQHLDALLDGIHNLAAVRF